MNVNAVFVGDQAPPPEPETGGAGGAIARGGGDKDGSSVRGGR